MSFNHKKQKRGYNLICIDTARSVYFLRSNKIPMLQEVSQREKPNLNVGYQHKSTITDANINNIDTSGMDEDKDGSKKLPKNPTTI